MPHSSRRCFQTLLVVCCLTGIGAPIASGAPAEHPANGEPFVNGLAQAERQHDYVSLLAACDREVAAHPQDREVYRRRALARWGAHEYEAALADFGRAIDLAHRQKASARTFAVLFYGRALIRREQHDPRAEAAELGEAIHADQTFTDPLNDLAWMRATDPDASLHDGRQAVALARQACKTVPGSVKYLDTLAAAYAEAGDAKRAADAERQAIKAARSIPDPTGEQKGFLATAPELAESYAKGGRHPGATSYVEMR